MPRRRYLSTALLLFVLFGQSVFAQSPDRSGRWAGPMRIDGAPAGLEITLTRDNEVWRSTLRFRLQGQEIASEVQALNISGDSISFSIDVDGKLVKFNGEFLGETLSGTLEEFEGQQKVADGNFTLTRGGEMPTVPRGPANSGQVADLNFDAKVTNPVYVKNGPRVLFDEAHNNFHTATGRYKPFADLISSDGYQIVPGKSAFTGKLLKDYRLLIISNALGSARMNDQSASNPAFTQSECDAVLDWVRNGGSLLLIADHAPMGSANQILAQVFGVNMSKKYTMDNENFQKESGNRGFIVYTRESGQLADHAITRGRNESERINKVIAFTGQSLKGPADSFAFMRLADSAQDVLRGEEPVSAKGRAQGIALKFGKGRVIVMGEAGMLTAQVTGAQRSPFGMNIPGIDNRQLALNIMHWLSGKL